MTQTTKKVNYSEFKKTYSWLTKTYPDTTAMYSRFLSGETIGTVETTRYAKRGTRWIEISKTTENITAEYYMNIFDAVPFFRRLGGSERVTMSYTYQGYLPVEVSSISPDRKEKIVRRVSFKK